MSNASSKNANAAPLTVIDLGGSIVVPENIDTEFIAKMKRTILEFVQCGRRCIIVVGGGKTCRRYQEAARTVEDVSSELLDWIGIRATHLNATLLQAIFHEHAYPSIITDPERDANDWTEPILISGGWKPGRSTDFVSAFLAHRFQAQRVIVATNIDFVYSADIRKDPNATPFSTLTWERYRALIPHEWTPGLSTPVDPIAAQFSQEHKILTHLLNGNDMENFRNCLLDEQWTGTIIE